MPPQGRLGDKAMSPADAHGCPGCPHPTVGPGIGGSPDVNVNSRPALRVGDAGIHTACCGANSWTAQKGAATVNINGKAAYRLGDMSKHCGSVGQLIEGSADVIVGDAGGGGGGGGGGAGSSGGGANGSSGGGGAGGDNSGTAETGSGASGGGSSAGNTADSAKKDDATQSAADVQPDQIEVQVLTAAGDPASGVDYELTLPDGTKRVGQTGSDGYIRISGLTQKGDCQLTFPNIVVNKPN